MRTVIACLLALLPLTALAQTPMSADEFDTYVTGKTLTYSQFGQVFGIEEYLADRKVRWSVAENTCQYGTWYPQGENICFVYENDPTPHCWTFWQGDTGLTALSVEMAPGAELNEVNQTDTPLSCPGPDVGA